MKHHKTYLWRISLAQATARALDRRAGAERNAIRAAAEAAQVLPASTCCGSLPSANASRGIQCLVFVGRF